MEEFIEQQLEIFEEDTNPANTASRPMLELTHPDIRLIQDCHFFIAGHDNVYLLDSEDHLAYKMSKEEIDELPVEILYTGQEKPNYQVDEKNALELIIKIIQKMNIMQTSEIYSFPLGPVILIIQ